MSSPRVIPHSTRAAGVRGLLLVCLLGVAVRLRGITAPPFDFHPTRQYYALLFAQDFRHSLCGDPGSREALAARANRQGEALLEPPVIPAVTSLAWCALGREVTAAPRALLAVSWSAGALALGLLARALGGGAAAAVVAAAWMLFHPYAVAAGRSVQPDGPMVTLLLVGAWSLARDAARADRRAWRLGLAALSGAVLAKLVALFFAAPLLWWSLRERPKPLRDKGLIALSLLPAGLWYAWGWFVEGSLRHQGSGRFRPSLLASAVFWRDLGAGVERVTGLWPLALCLALAALSLRGRARALSLAWFAGYACLGVAFTQHIYTHDYYSLPLVPWVGLVLGLAVDARLRGVRRAHPRAATPLGITVGLALAALSARGVVSAWRAADQAEREAGDEVAQAERVGAAVGHATDVLMLARWYGLPMKFHGRFAAEYWPDHVELAEDTRRWTPEARIARGYHGQRFRWFVLADPREVPLQPALVRMITARCARAPAASRAQVFACDPGALAPDGGQTESVNTTR